MDESLNKPREFDNSFSESMRVSLSSATHWTERELEALCWGLPPEKYGDYDEIAPAAERDNVHQQIGAAIKSGAIYAELKPNARDTEFRGRWLIERVRAIRWAISIFPKFPEWLVNDEVRKTIKMQEAEKWEACRYTLGEVAKLIAENIGQEEKEILRMLVRAVERYELSMYEPGKTVAINYGLGRKLNRVRILYEECYGDDLNKLLADKHPRIAYRFATPTALHAEDKLTSQVESSTDHNDKLRNVVGNSEEPFARRAAQEKAILSTLKFLTVNPKKLEPNPKGKPGIKSKVWGLVKGKKKTFSSRGVFDTAWKRMRKNKDLADDKK